ncbi:MAG: cytochrome c nitrite reductase small subunit [Pirellulaceae bacterium]
MTQDTPNAEPSEEGAPVIRGSDIPQSEAKPVFRVGKIAILLTVLLGILFGLGTFTFGYGKGASYLSNNPETCVNCHVMQEHLDSWQHSSHHHVAVCNDCHLPHDAIGKWVTKADNGFFHSLAFTLQNYHDPIQIKPRNARVTQSTCVSCHKDFVHSLLPAVKGQDMQSCVHCHSDVGHAHR